MENIFINKVTYLLKEIIRNKSCTVWGKNMMQPKDNRLLHPKSTFLKSQNSNHMVFLKNHWLIINYIYVHNIYYSLI